MSEDKETPVPGGIMTVAGGPVVVTEPAEDTDSVISGGPGKHPPVPTPERPTHAQIAEGAYEFMLGNNLAGEPNDEKQNWYDSEMVLWRKWVHEMDRLHAPTPE